MRERVVRKLDDQRRVSNGRGAAVPHLKCRQRAQRRDRREFRELLNQQVFGALHFTATFVVQRERRGHARVALRGETLFQKRREFVRIARIRYTRARRRRSLRRRDPGVVFATSRSASRALCH